MNQTHYASRQILAALLKAHNIRKVVVGSDALNSVLAGLIQQDSFFEVCSAVDDRSAGYIACGIAAESREPVVLVCGGLTNFRSLMPPMTEAFYRQLPVLAVSSSSQLSDKTSLPKDCAKLSLQIPQVHSKSDEHICTVKINEGLLELKHNGCGPVHINLPEQDTACELSEVHAVRRISASDKVMPKLKAGTVSIFAGAHPKWSKKLTELADAFCQKYNGAVFCSLAGNYRGKYAVSSSLEHSADLMIYLGRVSEGHLNAKEVWSVSLDGEVNPELENLGCVFEMRDEEFFSRYVGGESSQANVEYYSACRSEYERLVSLVPELPFSSAWVARHTAKRFPDGSTVRFGLRDSLRAWELFELPETVAAYLYPAGSGIDGCISSVLGASLASPEKLFFGVVDGSAFIYDINALGNRHKGSNIRLMVINDTETSSSLIKDYASDLGFEYLSASDKNEFLANIEHFTAQNNFEKPVVFEIFTDSASEREALTAITNLSGGSK